MAPSKDGAGREKFGLRSGRRPSAPSCPRLPSALATAGVVSLTDGCSNDGSELVRKFLMHAPKARVRVSLLTRRLCRAHDRGSLDERTLVSLHSTALVTARKFRPSETAAFAVVCSGAAGGVLDG